MEFSFVVLKILLSASIIAGISWYAGKKSVTGWLPDCFPHRIHFSDLFFLFLIQGYGKDKPVRQLHCREHSTFPFIFRSIYSEPMAQVEFLSYYSFRIHFVVCGIPDSFANL